MDNWLVKTILGAVISFFVPWILKQVLPAPATARAGADPGASRFPAFSWVALLAIGGGLGGAISAVMGSSLGGFGNWAIFGAMIGVMQWLVLHRLAEVGPWFALASSLGWAAFAFLQQQQMGHEAWAVVGLLVGVLQWLGLVGKLRGSFWWIPANALAWFAGGMVGLGVGLALLEGGDFATAWVIGWTVVGAVGAVVLAVPLSWMWKRTAAAAAA